MIPQHPLTTGATICRNAPTKESAADVHGLVGVQTAQATGRKKSVLPLPGSLSLASGLLLLTFTVASSSTTQAAVISQYFALSDWSALPNTKVLGVETFDSYLGYYATPLSATTAGVTWSAESPFGLYVGADAGSPLMSVNDTVDPLSFFFNYARGLSGIGGNIFITDFDFRQMSGAVLATVTLSDSTTQTFSRTIADPSVFWGFYSSGAPIASITIAAGEAYPKNSFASADNLTFMRDQRAATIPETGVSLLGFFLTLIGLHRLRVRMSPQ